MKRYYPVKVPVLDCFKQTNLPGQRSGVGCKPGICRYKPTCIDPLLDALIVYANDQHSVIGELILFDGLAETQRVEPSPETVLVVHINDFDTEFFSRLFQACSVNSGS